jgi:unsaturated rhamnogalacturonyl hydrolase
MLIYQNSTIDFSQNPKSMQKITQLLLLILAFCCFNACKTTSNLGRTSNTTIEKAMLKALAWQEANPIQEKTPTDWTNGAYYTGVMKAHQATENQAFYDAMLNMGKRNQWKTHDRLFHADDIVISNAYLHLKNLGEKEVNLESTERFIQAHLYEPQDWKVGKGNKEQVILWWWCDALFMAPPLLTKYSLMKNDTKYLDEMHKYYMECYGLLFNKEENLFTEIIAFCKMVQLMIKKKIMARKYFGQGVMVGYLQVWR